jgi:hypothetical protein
MAATCRGADRHVHAPWLGEGRGDEGITSWCGRKAAISWVLVGQAEQRMARQRALASSSEDARVARRDGPTSEREEAGKWKQEKRLMELRMGEGWLGCRGFANDGTV